MRSGACAAHMSGPCRIEWWGPGRGILLGGNLPAARRFSQSPWPRHSGKHWVTPPDSSPVLYRYRSRGGYITGDHPFGRGTGGVVAQHRGELVSPAAGLIQEAASVASGRQIAVVGWWPLARGLLHVQDMSNIRSTGASVARALAQTGVGSLSSFWCAETCPNG